MIFVALGTQDKEFTRLLKKIDKLIEKGIIKEEVVVQAGYTKYESNNMKIFDYLSNEEFKKYIKKAKYVICHAGVGTIFDCLKENKKIIAVTRLAKYNEHNNDHQIEIAREYGNLNYLIPVYDVNKLEEAINKIDTFKFNKYTSNNKNFTKVIEEYIDNNEKRTIKSMFNKYKEIIMYLIFGVLTTLVSLITYYLLTYTILNPEVGIELQIANIISWIVSVTFAYFTNRKYVFESNNKNKLKEAGSFYIARLLTLFMDMGIMFLGVTILNGNDKIIKIISQIVVIVANYVLSKLMVFKKKEK